MTTVPAPGGDYFTRIAGRGASHPAVDHAGADELRFRPSVAERLADSTGDVIASGPLPADDGVGGPDTGRDGDRPAGHQPAGDPRVRAAGVSGTETEDRAGRRATLVGGDAVVIEPARQEFTPGLAPPSAGPAEPDVRQARRSERGDAESIVATPESAVMGSESSPGRVVERVAAPSVGPSLADELVAMSVQPDAASGPVPTAESTSRPSAPFAEPHVPAPPAATGFDDVVVPDAQAVADAFMSSVLGGLDPPVVPQLPLDDAPALVIDELTIELIGPAAVDTSPRPRGPGRPARTMGRLPGGYRSAHRGGV